MDTLEILSSKARLPIASRDFFVDLVKNVPTPAIIFDSNLNCLEASQRLQEEFGLSPDDFMGKHQTEVFPDIPNRWTHAYKRALSGEALGCERGHYNSADGGVLWCRWEAVPWRESDEATGGIIIFMENLTQQVELSDRLSFTLSAGDIGVWERDLVTGKDYRSEVCNRLLGTESEAAHEFEDAVFPEDLPHIHAAGERAVQDRTSFSVDFRVKSPDLKTLWLSSRGDAVFADDGTPLKLRGAILDVTKAKNASETLEKERDRLREMNALNLQAEQHLLMGSWKIDIATNKTKWSEGLFHLLGLPPEKTYRPMEDVMREVIHPHDRRAVLRELKRAISKSGSIDIENRIIRPDGTIRWLRNVGSVRMGLNGKPAYLVGSTQDVTERYEFASSLREFQSNLERTIEERTRELNIANAAKTEFLANMSHEIRSPLNNISLLAHLSEKVCDGCGRQTTDYIRRIRSSVDTLSALIDDILDFSKVKSGQISLEEIPFCLTGLFDRMKGEHQEMALRKGITLHFPDLPIESRVIGDPKRLQQVMSNLIGNAIKFTDRGCVWIKATVLSQSVDAGVLRFEVIDTGIGIHPDALENLTDPFTQADSSITRRYGGTGLGLSICKHLIQKMGGELEISSTPGLGSNFSFNLPLRLESTEELGALIMGRPEQAMLEGMRILLVDDDEDALDALKEAFEVEGAFIASAENGFKAVEWLQTKGNSCDVVLMDIQMPLMDGITATKIIRESLQMKELPILAVTAGVLPDQQQSALDAGITELVRKPVNIESLVNRLAKLRG